MKRTSVYFVRVTGIIAAAAFTVLACRREALPVPANAQAIETFANSMHAAKKSDKPGAYIKASEDLAIPFAVAVPEGGTRIATYYAEGVQQYKAQEVAGLPGIYQWVFVGPEADLYEHNNKLVGTHGAGPYWQVSPVDSIFAQHFLPVKAAPSPDEASIDWLLLKPKAGTIPTGIFSEVEYIQRIATQGGKAPLTLPVSATETTEVKYKAVYRFSKTSL